MNEREDSLSCDTSSSSASLAALKVVPSSPLHAVLEDSSAAPRTAMIRELFPIETIESSSPSFSSPLTVVTPTRQVTVSIHSSTTTSTQDQSNPLWSTGLGERLAGDVAVAAVVTAAAAPFLAVVDRALVQRAAAGSSVTFWQSARTSMSSMLSRPVAYARSPAFLWMWATYAATYSAANGLRTITEQQEYRALGVSQLHHERQKQATAGTLFFGTTAVNSAASMAKDRAYAKLYGGSAAATSIPRISYALWMARDLTVIGSSFVLPTYVARHLHERHGFEEPAAQAVAQVATPIAAQLIAGPLHFVGLDCCTRPLATGATLRHVVANRVHQLKQAYSEIVLARMLRILPGYGIAGVCNTNLRRRYREFLVERRVQSLMAEASAITSPLPLAATSSPLLLRPSATGELASLLRSKSRLPSHSPPPGP